MKPPIATIGYEGSTIDNFVATLRAAAIDVLIDIRDLPLSRKKGFSKSQLAEVLAASGIGYVHLKGLGNPKDGRLAARAGQYGLYQKIFRRHMQTEVALRDIDIAADLVRAGRACLMCFECDHVKCHRSIVADRLAQITRLTVMPLSYRMIFAAELLPNLTALVVMADFQDTAEAIILVKASPQVGKKHGETVCCAGVNAKGEWVRLYPVSFRTLDQARQFQTLGSRAVPVEKAAG